MPEVPLGYANSVAHITSTGDNEPMQIAIGLDLIQPETFGQEEADAMSTIWSDFLFQMMVGDYSYAGTTIEVGAVGDNGEFTSNVDAIAGNLSGDPLVQNTAVLVTKRSGLTGRKNRGRMFVPGYPETEVGGFGLIDADNMTALQGHADNFLAAIEGETWAEGAVILHAPGDATTPTAISSLIVERLVATQRRRLRG